MVWKEGRRRSGGRGRAEEGEEKVDGEGAVGHTHFNETRSVEKEKAVSTRVSLLISGCVFQAPAEPIDPNGKRQFGRRVPRERDHSTHQLATLEVFSRTCATPDCIHANAPQRSLSLFLCLNHYQREVRNVLLKKGKPGRNPRHELTWRPPPGGHCA